MLKLISSEYQKQKRTFTKRVAFFAPIVSIILCTLLCGGMNFQQGSYNWWYTMLLPAALSLICAGVIQKDKKKLNYRRILSLPTEPEQVWLGKIGGCTLLFFISTVLFFIGTTIGGLIFGSSISIDQGIVASLLLFITFLWQIPFCMLLADKLGQFVAILINLAANVLCVIFTAKTVFWWVPFSVPTRLMCPVIHVLPNGLSVPANDPLMSSGVILPGVLITSALFVVLSILTTLPYRKLEAK